MRTHRIYLEKLEPGSRTLLGSQAHHLSEVLRVKPGAEVCAFDGMGAEATARVVEVQQGRVTLELESLRASEAEATLDLTLAVALLKGDKMSEVVRRGTELGVLGFVPVLSRHCDVRELKTNKLDRWRRVAREASKQSGRSRIPQIAGLQRLETLELSGLSVVAHPRAQATLREVTESTIANRNGLLVITGPEGGLGDDEVARLVERGAASVRLGSRILRAETAPIAAAAALLVPEAL